MSGFRDDEEAVRQRAEALDRDLERERAEKERLQRELDEARSAAGEDHALAEKVREEKRAAEEKKRAAAEKQKREAEKRGRDAARGGLAGWWRKHWGGLVAGLSLGLGVPIGIALLVVGPYWWGEGQVRGAWFVSRPDGASAVLLLSHAGDWVHLELVDPALGRRLVRRDLWENTASCAPGTPGFLWCTVADKLELRTLSDLKVVVDEGGLVRGAAELAAGIHDRSLEVLASGSIVVTTNAGHICSIDPMTLRVQRIDEEQRRKAARASEDSMTSYESPVPGVSLDGSIERHLVRSPQRSERLAPELTFLHGKFLRPVIPGGFIVLHDSTLDQNKRQLVLTALSPEGKKLWSRAVPHSDVKQAQVVGGLLVIVGEHHVFGLQVSDGALRWTYDT